MADTGIGIAPDDQEAIFEEFTQLENALQRRVKGTGLGLPLCRKLATLLGGRVEVDSRVGVGSTFSVVLPLRYQRPDDCDEMLPEVALLEKNALTGDEVLACLASLPRIKP